jgi:hypothetical protein
MWPVLTVGFKFSSVEEKMPAKCHFESLLIKGISNVTNFIQRLMESLILQALGIRILYFHL